MDSYYQRNREKILKKQKTKRDNNKKKFRAEARNRYWKNREAILGKRKVNRKLYPEKELEKDLRIYGLTLTEYNLLLEKQNSLCALCRKRETTLMYGKPRRLSVDHDHKTKKVRGLLCNPCNRALGYFREDTDILKRAIRYLTNFKRRF